MENRYSRCANPGGYDCREGSRIRCTDGQLDEELRQLGYLRRDMLPPVCVCGAGVFQKYLKVIEREAEDVRNFVRKAVNWALRNIGKRNLKLNREAIRVAERLRKRGSRTAGWIATDALRELRSDAV